MHKPSLVKGRHGDSQPAPSQMQSKVSCKVVLRTRVKVPDLAHFPLGARAPQAMYVPHPVSAWSSSSSSSSRAAAEQQAMLLQITTPGPLVQ